MSVLSNFLLMNIFLLLLFFFRIFDDFDLESALVPIISLLLHYLTHWLYVIRRMSDQFASKAVLESFVLRVRRMRQSVGLLLWMMILVVAMDSVHQQTMQGHALHELEVVKVVVKEDRLLLAFMRV